MACGIEVSGEASSIEHVGIAVDGPTLAPSPSAVVRESLISAFPDYNTGSGVIFDNMPC